MNSESTNNKQNNYNKVDSQLTIHNSPFTTHKRQLSWIIASLGQVAHFTSVVIRNVLATSGWVRSSHTAPYAKFAHNSLVKAIAFTLAETLVVMGIIGVVAALTIPNLNQSTGNREKVAKVKKIYANLEDAYGRATAVYGPYEDWFKNETGTEARTKRCVNRITEFMKISKDYGFDSTSEKSKILLADGTSLTITVYPSEVATITVDIDGVKGANTNGVDRFDFNLDKNGINPWGRESTNDYLKTNCFSNGNACTAWVIDVGNMDYLKANNGVCPNGKELTWENTTCK